MIDTTVGKPLPNSVGHCSNSCRRSRTPPTGPRMAQRRHWQGSRRARDSACSRRGRQVQGQLCAVRCGWMMVRVVAACPVSRDVVLTLGMPTHALQPWKRFTTHFVVVSIDVLNCTTPVHRSQVPRQFAGTHEHCRTEPAAATSLWMVSLVRRCLAN